MPKYIKMHHVHPGFKKISRGDTFGPPIRFDEEGQGEGRVISAKRGKVCFLAVGGMDAHEQTAVAGCGHVPPRLDQC